MAKVESNKINCIDWLGARQLGLGFVLSRARVEQTVASGLELRQQLYKSADATRLRLGAAGLKLLKGLETVANGLLAFTTSRREHLRNNDDKKHCRDEPQARASGTYRRTQVCPRCGLYSNKTHGPGNSSCPACSFVEVYLSKTKVKVRPRRMTTTIIMTAPRRILFLLALGSQSSPSTRS